ATNKDLADTSMAGGWVNAFAYKDANSSASWDAGDTPLQNILLTLNPGNRTAYTDVNGNASLFAGVGTYTLAATLPDSFVTTTSNPVTGSMSNGGSGSAQFGMANGTTATVRGTVFLDVNKNGTLDAGEAGVPGVWVGVTPDYGVTVLSYQYTDASGGYS